MKKQRLYSVPDKNIVKRLLHRGTMIPGRIKAAYIFSVLPYSVRSPLLTGIGKKERERLNNALKSADGLGTAEKTSILRIFIRRMHALAEKRRRITEFSSIAGVTLLGFTVLASAAAAFALRRGTDERILFIETILAGGGIHLALIPVVAGYLRTAFNQSPVDILLSSRNRALDSALGCIAGLCVAAMFLFLSGGSVGAIDPIPGAITLLLSVTAGPVLEELVFRHLLFQVAGKSIGYIAAGVISSAIFTAVHLPDGAGLAAAYFTAGAALCALRRIRGSLYPALAAHALSNLFIQIF